MCWLKDSVPGAIHAPGIVSGVKVWTPSEFLWAQNLCYDGDTCRAAEVDGLSGSGQRAELVSIPSGGTHVRVSRAWGFYHQVAWPAYYYWRVDLEDVDGDGKAELTGYRKDLPVEVATFEGDGDPNGAVWTTGVVKTPFVCRNVNGCSLANVNGDFDADLVELPVLAGSGQEPGDVWVSLAPYSDVDGDLVPDEFDNCPSVENADQADADGDGLGDACPTECADGLDNDGDGVADADDPGCSSTDDLSERTPLVQCDDGADNDGDGQVDYPGDPQCADPEDDREAGGGSRCGLGFELALLLPALMWMWKREGGT
jgi:hypothetical protein